MIEVCYDQCEENQGTLTSDVDIPIMKRLYKSSNCEVRNKHNRLLNV